MLTDRTGIVSANDLTSSDDTTEYIQEEAEKVWNKLKKICSEEGEQMNVTVDRIMRTIGGRAPVAVRYVNSDGSAMRCEILTADDPGVLSLDAISTHAENIDGKDTIIIGASGISDVGVA